MKAKLHIKTGDYEFIEIDVEKFTHEEIIGEYRALKKKFDGGIGLEAKEFNRILDDYLIDGEMESEEYEGMNLPQQYVIQELKKAFKRINK